MYLLLIRPFRYVGNHFRNIRLSGSRRTSEPIRYSTHCCVSMGPPNLLGKSSATATCVIMPNQSYWSIEAGDIIGQPLTRRYWVAFCNFCCLHPCASCDPPYIRCYETSDYPLYPSVSYARTTAQETLLSPHMGYVATPNGPWPLKTTSPSTLFDLATLDKRTVSCIRSHEGVQTPVAGQGSRAARQRSNFPRYSLIEPHVEDSHGTFLKVVEMLSSAAASWDISSRHHTRRPALKSDLAACPMSLKNP